MANIIGWFAVSTAQDPIGLLRRVRGRAAAEDVPDGFLIGPRTPSASDFVGTLLLGQPHAAVRWAQAASDELKTTAISFFLLEGTWNYSIFRSGEEIASMEVWCLPKPMLYGDVNRAASLFSVSPALLRKYEEAWQRSVAAAERDEEIESAPFPGDEFAPDDEWGHVDFARRLCGVEYPDPSVSVEFRWDTGDLPVTNAHWIGLRTRLPMPEHEPRHGAKELDLDNFPTGDDPF